MKIGIIDVDGHHFPNIPLMKISAWHKRQGDAVEWYQPLFSGHCDIVYQSKVFSFSPDYPYYIDADKVIQGGSGYCIELSDGREVYHTENDHLLPPEVEHIYPDYSLYPELTRDTAYGFLTRGCPVNCAFCHVGCKEGRISVKVADLEEFWKGQKNIVLLDPNITACRDWESLFGQLIDSQAWIDFSQGVSIKCMTAQKAGMLQKMKIKQVHFAWDRYEDKEMIVQKFQEFKEATGWDKRKMSVFVLTNFDTTLEQDLERIYTLREMGYGPYVMIYNKQNLPRGHDLKRLQRWVNSRIAFAAVERFEDFK